MSKRLPETQIISLLKEADLGIPVKEICRKYSIATQLFISDVKNMAEWKILIFKD